MRIAQIAALSVNTSSFNPNVFFCVNCFVREYHNIFKSAPNTSEQLDLKNSSNYNQHCVWLKRARLEAGLAFVSGGIVL